MSELRACPDDVGEPWEFPESRTLRGGEERADRGWCAQPKVGTLAVSSPHTRKEPAMTTTTDSSAERRPVQPAVILPDHPEYDEARSAWNLAADQRPAGVVLARSEADVLGAVALAAERGLRVAPQTTGHLAAALPDLERHAARAHDDRRCRGGPRGAARAHRRRRDLAGGPRRHRPARPRRAVRLDARRRRRRLPARWRSLVARAQQGPGRQPRPRHRGRHRRRPARALRRRDRARAVLGAARRRRATSGSSRRSRSSCSRSRSSSPA